MLPHFSTSSSATRTDTAHVQPMHMNSYHPAVEFSDSPMETHLDLNFSQKGIQNMVRMQNEFDTSIQPNDSEANANMIQDDLVIGESEVSAPSNDGNVDIVEASTPKSKGGVVDALLSKTRAGLAVATASTQQNLNIPWTHSEMIVLFDSKKVQAEKAESGPRKLRSSMTGKWEEIADSCKAVGLQRTASQCREKWERLWPAFRKILDWEGKVSDKKTSYWTMTEDVRIQGGFPIAFEKEVYDEMLARFGFVTTLNPASPILISLDVDSGGTNVVSYKEPVLGAASFDSSKEMGQNGIMGVDDGVLAIVEQKTSGRKRRGGERGSSTKVGSLDSNKKLIVLLDPKEEAIGHAAPSPAKEPRTGKSKTPLSALDITERRLLLEERKLKLAEQRFLLEEKKLEATIEIGKGLIASMERMTGTISGLGPHF